MTKTKTISAPLLALLMMSLSACSSSSSDEPSTADDTPEAANADLPAHGEGSAYIQVGTQNDAGENVFIFSSLFDAAKADMNDYKRAFRDAVASDERFGSGPKFGIAKGPYESADRGDEAWAAEWNRLNERNDVAEVVYLAWTPADEAADEDG